MERKYKFEVLGSSGENLAGGATLYKKFIKILPYRNPLSAFSCGDFLKLEGRIWKVTSITTTHKKSEVDGLLLEICRVETVFKPNDEIATGGAPILFDLDEMEGAIPELPPVTESLLDQEPPPLLLRLNEDCSITDDGKTLVFDKPFLTATDNDNWPAQIERVWAGGQKIFDRVGWERQKALRPVFATIEQEQREAAAKRLNVKVGAVYDRAKMDELAERDRQGRKVSKTGLETVETGIVANRPKPGLQKQKRKFNFEG